MRLLFAASAFAFCVKRIVHDKFPFEDFMIAKPEGAKTASVPAQTFSGRMRIGRMRISRAHNLTQQNECRIDELISFHDRIERNVFAVVSQLAIRHVEYDSVTNFCALRVLREENEVRIWVDEFFDEAWAGNSIDFSLLAGNPFH